MRYLKSAKFNDHPEPDDVVDQDFVERFIGKETLAWFRNLGGTEEVQRSKDGGIYVKSVSPDGLDVRETWFTPLPEVKP